MTTHGVGSFKRSKQLLETSNVTNFALSDSNIDILVKVNELKEKLLIGMIPSDLSKDIYITSMENNIQKPLVFGGLRPAVKRG